MRKYRVICQAREDNEQMVVLSVFNDQQQIVKTYQSLQYDFCEKLPLMISEIISFLRIINKRDKITIIFSSDFVKEKHLTTYRVFYSFISGFTIIDGIFYKTHVEIY